MGCDAHIFMEGYELDTDKGWELLKEFKVHFRNYEYFGHIAGVRGDGPYDEAAWHPMEASEASLGIRLNGIGHDLGWMRVEDFLEVSRKFADSDRGICPEHVKNLISDVEMWCEMVERMPEFENVLTRVVIFFDS